MSAEVTATINKLRKRLLVHRYCYYVLADTLVSDAIYDKWERELRVVIEEHAEIASQAEFHWCCPTRTPGSSNPDSYPVGIPGLAMSLLGYAKTLEKKAS